MLYSKIKILLTFTLYIFWGLQQPKIITPAVPIPLLSPSSTTFPPWGFCKEMTSLVSNLIIVVAFLSISHTNEVFYTKHANLQRFIKPTKISSLIEMAYFSKEEILPFKKLPWFLSIKDGAKSD